MMIDTIAQKCAVLTVLITLLSGCNQETLYNNLSEQEANEMVALLHQSGLDATKRGSGEDHFSVMISNASFANAVEILRAAGLPKKDLQNLGDVFKREGFVSTPLEERARLNYAQSQELTRTIEAIDGVVMARVHLALPEKDPLSEIIKPSSASVFVKYNGSADVNSYKSEIKALLVNSIEGLPYENVTVVMFPTKARSTLIAASNNDSTMLMIYQIGGGLLFVCLLLGGLTIALLNRRKRHEQPKSTLHVVENSDKGKKPWKQQIP